MSVSRYNKESAALPFAVQTTVTKKAKVAASQDGEGWGEEEEEGGGDDEEEGGSDVESDAMIKMKKPAAGAAKKAGGSKAAAGGSKAIAGGSKAIAGGSKAKPKAKGKK